MIITAFFFTHDPNALTQLGWALKCYDIRLRYAPTPQAKDKVEREHPFWQGRWPPGFASEKIAEIEVAHPPIDALRAHPNAQAVHRELGQTPQRAGGSGLEGKALRAASDPALPLVDLCVARAPHP